MKVPVGLYAIVFTVFSSATLQLGRLGNEVSTDGVGLSHFIVAAPPLGLAAFVLKMFAALSLIWLIWARHTRLRLMACSVILIGYFGALVLYLASGEARGMGSLLVAILMCVYIFFSKKVKAYEASGRGSSDMSNMEPSSRQEPRL